MGFETEWIYFQYQEGQNAEPILNRGQLNEKRYFKFINYVVEELSKFEYRLVLLILIQNQGVAA